MCVYVHACVYVHILSMFAKQNMAHSCLHVCAGVHSQWINETTILPWVIMTNTGDVVGAHCDCMTGLAETCMHVAALLFKVAAVVRTRQKMIVMGVAIYWMVPV